MPYCSVEPGSREVVLDRGREHLNKVRRRRKAVKQRYTTAQAVHFDHARAVAGEALYDRQLMLEQAGVGRASNRWYELPQDDPTYLKRKAGMHVQHGVDRQGDQLGWIQVIGAVVSGVTTVIAQRKASDTAEKAAESAIKVARIELEAEKARTAQATILAQASERRAAATPPPGALGIPGVGGKGGMMLGVGVLALGAIWMFTRKK